MKHLLQLNEGRVFVAINWATVLWGLLGALIIVPLLAPIGLLGRYVRCRLLHLEPWPEVLPRQTTPEASTVDNNRWQQRNEDDASPLDSWPDGRVPVRFRRPGW